MGGRSGYSSSYYYTPRSPSTPEPVDALFERDCKEAAREVAGAHSSLFLRRGHLVVDDRLLVEHWWVTSGNRIVDPSFVSSRGHSRSKNQLEYLPLDPEGEHFDFSAGIPVCMRTWGECQMRPMCDWCAARKKILRTRPGLLPATIVIRFEEENTKPKRKVSWK